MSCHFSRFSLQCPCCWWVFCCSSCSFHSYFLLDWPSFHNYFPPLHLYTVCWFEWGFGSIFVGPWCVVFNMVFIHFSDCFLCFTHIIGTLVQFTLLLCYIGSYLFPGGVGTTMFITPCPGFHHGKTAPGAGRSSRGPPLISSFLFHTWFQTAFLLLT